MTKIDVYDSAMCCSTGVCGVDVDQRLVNFAADVEWAKQQGMRLPSNALTWGNNRCSSPTTPRSKDFCSARGRHRSR